MRKTPSVKVRVRKQKKSLHPLKRLLITVVSSRFPI